MADSKHTPTGPFEVRKSLTPADGEYDYAIGAPFGDRKHCIAEVYGRVAEDVRLDAERYANLFASAPELLEALEQTTAIVRLQNGNLHDDTNQIIAQAEAAIARAKGES